MAFARFARDLFDRYGGAVGRSCGGYDMVRRSGDRVVVTIWWGNRVIGIGGDRYWGRSVLGDSLASRVNAIDPYGFLRYTETQSRS